MKNFNDYITDIFSTDLTIGDIGYTTRPAYRKGFYTHQGDRQKHGNIQLNEERISFVFDENKRGGVITLSTDVNAVYKSDSIFQDKIKNWVDSKLKTLSNRIHKKSKVTKALSKIPDVSGFSIGNYMTGRYSDESGRIWDENSFSVEILGIDKNILDVIGSEFCRIFDQESVLIKSYDTGDIYFVEQDDELATNGTNENRINKINDLLK